MSIKDVFVMLVMVMALECGRTVGQVIDVRVVSEYSSLINCNVKVVLVVNDTSPITNVLLFGRTNNIIDSVTMFNGYQHVKFSKQVGVQSAPLFWGDAGVIDSINQTLPWNATFTCPIIPTTLTVTMYSGPLVRNRVFPSLNLSPPNHDIFQATVSTNDPFSSTIGAYDCNASIYVCQMILLRQGPGGPAVSSLYQLLLYPIGTDVGDYTKPINLTITSYGRTAYFVLPPLTNNTVTKTDSSTVFDLSLETGLVPTRPNAMYASRVSSTSSDALYFIYSNVSSTNQLISYFRVFKPMRTYPNGLVDNFALATIQLQQVQIFEALTTPSAFPPFIKTPYVAPTIQSSRTQMTNWTGGIQFRTNFVLPNYRSCYFGFKMTLMGPDDSFSYPFGVKSIADGGNTTLSVTYYVSGYIPNNQGSNLRCYYANVVVNMPALINYTDGTSPFVESFQIVPIGGSRYLLRTTISDAESGLSRMMVYFSTGEMYHIDHLDLYQGNSKYGYYEKLLELNTPPGQTVKYDLMLMNDANRISMTDVGYSSITGSPVGFRTAAYDIGAQDLIVFYFDKYVMDVSTSSMDNKLYISSPKILPSWKVTLIYGLVDENPSYQADATYNATLGLFVLPFTVPTCTITRQMQYYIRVMLPPGNSYTVFSTKDMTGIAGTLMIDGALIQKQFPTTSIVNIKSTSGDELPPMITECTAIPGKTVDLTLNGKATMIGWAFVIEDTGNGFLKGVINVISDVDGQVRRFELTPANKTGGDQFTGSYVIMFQVDPNYRSQTFTFLDIEVFDTSMNRGYYSTVDSDTRVVSPLAASMTATRILEFNIQLITGTTDITPPVLESLEVLTPTVDVGSHLRNVEVRFTVRESGSGYSLRHIPSVYITGYIFETYKLATSESSMVQAGDLYTFTASGIPPYGFAAKTSGAVAGGSTLAFISVYGLVDNSQNINGYATEDLPVSPQVARTVEIVYTHITPILERVELGQGVITVFGKNFGPNPTLVDALNINNPTVLFTKSFGSVVIAVFNITDVVRVEKTLLIQLRNQPDNSTYCSNTLSIRYIPGPEAPVIPLPNITCPGSPPCSNHGDCSPTLVVNVTTHESVPTTPVINPDNPSTVYTFNETTGVTIVGEIEIIRVRVLDQLGTELASYLLNQWNTSSTSSQSRDYVAQYGPNDGSNVGVIKVNVRLFTEDEDVKFAGDILPMKKNTIKYTITLANYTFPSLLDTMQVVMRATINTTDSNSCSVQQYGYTDGDKDNLFWMRVKVQSYSMYGHFIQKAMIDDRVSAVSNILLNDTVQTVANNTQSSQTLIGINVSAFTRQAYLDPDFLLLLDIDDAKDIDGAFCRQSSSSKLSPLAIAGIVVLCVAFVAAIAVGIMMRMKSIRKQRKEVNRINVRLSALKSQQQHQS
ncbi:hypothetical protein SAMD00019534_039990 [Acytostelium subglobosum LB1]|uniref:hypothetical protein n=1 Tax=Acytostelium subglobosum LB1 TaxID=1410327 RepID=UPI0006450A0B|nr:hypothetical protein SAMD00019534_039990 [Acytostelium subglobosum LB1]GAM20824.1 hypothetical protein SAMD00019534_039990 [Acytostelium subglobosum LB1]|eukprot:XP_012755958.1 hypothetical protein SAMD00019534_039990 [Acytostelium subglobosum LB1]